MVVQAMTLGAANRVSESLALIDRVTAAFAHAPRRELADTAAAALAFKGQTPGQMLTESEFTTLLTCISLSGRVAPGSIEVLVRYSAVAEPPRVLELIQESGTTGTLLPLVTALRQEMGEETQVPKEVDEVASDIRYRLAGLRRGVQFG